MAARGEVRYRVTADTGGFKSAMQAAEDAFAKFGKNVSSQAGEVSNILSKMGPAGTAAAVGVGAAAVAIAGIAKFTADAVAKTSAYADNLDALTASTGLSSQALQKLEVAAKLGNSSLEAVAGAVNKMQKNLIDGSKAFEKLGLKISDLKKLAPDQQMRAVAQAIEGLAGPADKAAARIAVFGKAGNELAGTLQAAASGAADLGGALSDEALAGAAALKDKTDLLETAWDRVVMQFGAAVAASPELQQALDDLKNTLVGIAEQIKVSAPDITAWFDKFMVGTRLAIGAIKPLAQFLHDLVAGPLTGDLGLAVRNLQSNVSNMGFDEFTRQRNASNALLAFPKTWQAPAGGGKHFAGAEDDAAAKKAYEEQLKDLHTAFKMQDDARDKEYKDVLAKWKVADAAQKAAKHEAAARDLDALEKDLSSQLDAWQNLFDALDQMTREDEANKQRQIQSWHSLGDAMTALGDVFATLGGDAESFFGRMISGFSNVAHAAGNFIDALAHGNIFDKIGAGLGLLGAGIGLIKGLFGDKEWEKVNDLRDVFVDAAGGLDELRKRAAAAGLTLDDLLAAKKVKDYQKAIEDLQAAFARTAAAEELLKDAMERYGITIDEMGPKFAQQALDKQALQLFGDYEALIAAGADHNAVLAKMAPAMNDYVNTAIKAGSTIPENLRPIIDEMIALGLLTDESGKAFTSAEEAGINFGKTLEESMGDVVKAIQDLIRELGRLYGLPPINIPVTVPNLPGEPPSGPIGEPKTHALGGSVHKTGWSYLHEGETVLKPGDDGGFTGGPADIGGFIDNNGNYVPPKKKRGGGSASSTLSKAIENAVTRAIANGQRSTPVNVAVNVPVDASTTPAAHRDQFIADVADEVGRTFQAGGKNFRSLVRAVRSAQAQG